MLTLNTHAPDFSASDQFNTTQTLSHYRGRFVILYFYPKDDTPGCTKEACNFRDNFHELEKMDVVILGVSKDSPASHKKFAEKYHLNFPLLADSDKKIIMMYGAWGKKKFFGKEIDGIKRITYLIDPEGKIAKIYEQVNPLLHIKEIMQDLYERRKN